MTDRTDRDIVPPPSLPAAPPPWELEVGYDLEEIYCAHVEAMTVITRGLPRLAIDRLRDMGGWAADRLREHGMESALVDRIEEALIALPSQEDYRRSSDSERTAASERWQRDLEPLLGAARAVVGVRAARYFDYGVMLSRIEMCVRTVLLISKLPEDMIEALSIVLDSYREELLRTTRQLVAFVLAEGPAGPRDPRQEHLERAFQRFAAYLIIWGVQNGKPDQEFQEQLRNISRACGFWTSDQIEQDVIWDLNVKVVPETDRMVLPVPHTARDRQELETSWTHLKQLTGTGDHERRHDLMRDLLDRCRCVLGPAHPLTLRVHIDVAAARKATGRMCTATMMMLDIANTAMHYYGPIHPARYKIVRYAHKYLQEWGSDHAQELYDFPLKSLVEREEPNLPPVLHDIRRAIRKDLGVERGQTPDG
jgi:hypothetical protein